MSQPKIAVTGANGQLGRKIVELFSDYSHLRSFDKVALDITDQQQVNDVLGEFKPDFIINAAAYTAVDKAELEIDQADKLNHLGPLYLGKVAEQLGAVLIHISTDYVFNGLKEEPYCENDPTEPQNQYGLSKLLGEKAIAEVCKKHIIIRTAWVFSEHGHNFVKTMLRLGQSRRELSIVSDQYGGPTYAGDIALAIRKVIDVIVNAGEARWGIYHFCGMPYISWYDFSKEIFSCAVNSKQIPEAPKLNAINSASYPTPAKRPAFSKLDCRKIESEFGVNCSNWQGALHHVIAHK